MSMMATPSVGVGYYDANGDWQPDESPYPVVFDSGPPSPSTDWAGIFGNLFSGLNETLAITQGGSVTNAGVYGSPGTANIAAAYPANAFNVTGAGISGLFSSPMILLLVGAVVLVMVAKK